jgi:hypothetical protein
MPFKNTIITNSIRKGDKPPKSFIYNSRLFTKVMLNQTAYVSPVANDNLKRNRVSSILHFPVSCSHLLLLVL